MAQQITREGGFVAFESADGTTLFYLKGTSPLFALVMAPWPAARSANCWIGLAQKAFFAVADGIYYIGKRGPQRTFPAAVPSLLQRRQRGAH